MLKIGALVALLFCFLLVVPAAAVPIVPTLEPRNIFSIYEQDSTIILPENFSCVLTGITYRAVEYSEGTLDSWYFPLFSNGNGTVNLRVSAQNCDFTITSLRVSKTNLYDDWYNNSYSLACKMDVNGTAFLDVTGFDYTDMDVYFNGTSQPAGEAWNITNFGIVLKGPANIEIQSNTTSFEPPQAAIQDDRPVYVGAFALSSVVFVAILGVFKVERDRKQKKPSTLKVRGRNLKGRDIAKNRFQLKFWKLKSINRLTELRIGTTCMYGLFIGLVALGQFWVNTSLTVAGLVAFAIAAALTTYFMVETES